MGNRQPAQWVSASRALWPWLAAIISGLLLAASFPPLEWGGAAWVALVPLLLALKSAGSRRAFLLGFAAATVFWLCSIHWLTHVTVPGWVGLSLYCAAYTGLFAMTVAAGLRLNAGANWLANLACMALVAVAWSGWEYLRGVLFTGFPWNPLAVSQYRNTALIQCAAWGGVPVVSALVAWVNAALAMTILRYAAGGTRGRRDAHPEALLGCVVVAAAFLYGVRAMAGPAGATTALRVALVQPNIPQDEKWSVEKIEMIYSRLRQLTAAAARVGGMQLIVWPETALPDDVRNSEPSYQLVYEAATNGIPILVGSMDTEWREENRTRFFNSSFLFNSDGIIVAGYDKRHLVPFGEYIPLQEFVPFIKALTPIQESFSPGATSTVFRLAEPAVAFAALICFEDTVAGLARESVRNGARLLINQTNDAWFDPSAASRQHMSHCVFRCVENRVPAVRCANTGVSCCIDRLGRVHDVLDDGAGEVKVSGFKSAVVEVPGPELPLTGYTRHGDWFGAGCAGLGLMTLAYTVWAGRRRAQRLAE